MDKVFSIVRQTYGRSPTDDLNDFDLNTAVWYIYVCYSSSCSSSWARLFGKSAIYQESTIEVCESVIQTTERLIKDQTEITGLSAIDWKQLMWREPF